MIKLFFFYFVAQYAYWMFSYNLNRIDSYSRMVDFKQLAKD